MVAISGSHIAVLTALCLFIARRLTRAARAGALVTIPVLLTYGWVIAGAPSAERAIGGATLFLCLGLVGLAASALRIVAVVAMVMALVDPFTVLAVGAWLSFGATLGIIVFASRLVAWATSERPKPDARHDAPASVGQRLWLGALGLLAATVAAEVVLTPIAAAVFARVSVAGLVLNFLAIPAMAVIQIAGLITVALSPWWPAAASVTAHVVHLGASVLIGSAKIVDVARWLSWRVPPVSWIWLVLFYAGLVIALVTRRRAARATAIGAVAGCLLVIVTAPGVEGAGPAAGWMRITVLDVGQGDAILLQFPDGHCALVDTGGVPGPFDLGGRVVTPALWASGVRRLDWLVLSHGDRDHMGAAPAVVDDLRPREIWEGVPVPAHAPLEALRREAHDLGAAWRRLQAGDSIELGGVELDVLHPPRPDWERPKVRNDDSVVLQVRFGDVEVLLTGDAGEEFERTYAPEDPPAPLRILKVGHHGSRTASSAPFVAALRPQVALVSVGRGNLFGHPAPEVVARYERDGAALFRTDRDGAVTVETDGRGVEVRTLAGKTRRWMVRR